MENINSNCNNAGKFCVYVSVWWNSGGGGGGGGRGV